MDEMLRRVTNLILALIFGLLVSVVPAHAAEATQRVIVKFKPAVPQVIQNRLNDQLRVRLIESLLTARTFVVAVPAGLEETVANFYQRSRLVDYAEPDGFAQAVEIPNDPEFANQWGQTKIETPQAWDTTSGGPGVQVAILDTGITDNHTDLTGKVDSWVNFTDAASSYDNNSHGTHVAGIVAAMTNNNLGVAGTGRDSRLQSVKVLNDSGSGYYSWVANGIYWAADNGAEVINMSLGGTSRSTALEQAVNYAWSKGVVLAAAAGNNGSSSRLYPAYYANNIAVAATDQNDRKASWSNYGSWVDVAAPGVSIVSTTPDENYAYYSGTSMATPHVAGVAALIFDAFPGYTNQQVREPPRVNRRQYFRHRLVLAVRPNQCRHRCQRGGSLTQPLAVTVSESVTVTEPIPVSLTQPQSFAVSKPVAFAQPESGAITIIVTKPQPFTVSVTLVVYICTSTPPVSVT